MKYKFSKPEKLAAAISKISKIPNADVTTSASAQSAVVVKGMYKMALFYHAILCFMCQTSKVMGLVYC